jgi:RNA polymerase sigma-70 factor (ECF subfamily)
VAVHSQTAIRLEDAILVDRLQSGDLAAFAELIDRYQDRLYNAQLRMVGDAEDARDLTQETFLRALSAIPSFRGTSQVYTWLFRIGMNLAMNHRRRGQREKAMRDPRGGHDPRVVRQAEHLLREAGNRTEPPPDCQLEAAERRELVRRAIDELQPEQRAIIILRDIENLDYEQIAEVLDVAIGTVKSRLHRARMALREMLAPYFTGA